MTQAVMPLVRMVDESVEFDTILVRDSVRLSPIFRPNVKGSPIEMLEPPFEWNCRLVLDQNRSHSDE